MPRSTKSTKRNTRSPSVYRSMYGSRFSSPYCPGASVYDDDDNDASNAGGKVCKGSMGKFKINSNGDCITQTGCSLAVSGSVCPGVSRGIKDLPNGRRQCQIPGKPTFEIDKDGNCVDPNNCAGSLTGVLKNAANAVADTANAVANKVGQSINKAGDAINKAGDAIKMAASNAVGAVQAQYAKTCPPGFDRYNDVAIPDAWAAKNAMYACLDDNDKGKAEADKHILYYDGAGNQVLGKKSHKMCYSRKQKGKKSKKRVCLSHAAVMRLKRGARKGGKHSHKK